MKSKLFFAFITLISMTGIFGAPEEMTARLFDLVQKCDEHIANPAAIQNLIIAIDSCFNNGATVVNKDGITLEKILKDKVSKLNKQDESFEDKAFVYGQVQEVIRLNQMFEALNTRVANSNRR